MQPLSLLVSASPSETSGNPARAGVATGSASAGFGMLVDGMARSLTQRAGSTQPAAGTAPESAGPAGANPDDSAMAAMLQAMGLTMPTAQSATQAGATVAGALPGGQADAALTITPDAGNPDMPSALAGLVPAPVPVMPGQPATMATAPAAATAVVPTPMMKPFQGQATVNAGGATAPAAGDTTEAANQGTPAALAAAAPDLASDPVTASAEATAQSTLVAQAGAPVATAAAGTVATNGAASDGGSSRTAPRAGRSGERSAMTAVTGGVQAAATATGAEARPAAFRLSAATGTTIGAVDGDAASASTAAGLQTADGGVSDGTLPTITGASAHATSRDLTTHAVATGRSLSTHATPGAQLTARIEQAVSDGQTTLTVQLDPEHLGRVDVTLEMQDGRLTAMIAAERPATLDLLQKDARLIERALTQGGMQVQPDGLQFSLREGGNQQWAQADQGRRGLMSYGQQVQAEPALNPLAPSVSRSDSLVDIQI